VLQIAQSLQFAGNRLADRKQSKGRTTLADVAKACGFSVSTVSIVLNEAPLAGSISARTKALVREAAASMGYRPDAFARSLRSRRSQLIGIMVFDISDPFCTLILNGIHSTLRTTSYLPIIMDAHNEAAQFERYLGMLLERRIEGLIVVANWMFVDIKRLAAIEQEQIPSVIVGQQMRSSAMSSIMVDNELGGYLALQHLHALGHREIAVIRGPEELPDSRKRWAGILRCAAEVGLKLRPTCVLDLPGASEPTAGFYEGRRITSDLLADGPHCTAILAFDDLTALGAISALHLAGLRVPEDYSVIGFDDVPNASLSTPTLSTVRQPMEHMGVTAAERLLAEMESLQNERSLPAKHWLTTPELVARDSTRRYQRKPGGKK
jgi:DNA-binding LacI/PurR family transcriptional regulator